MRAAGLSVAAAAGVVAILGAGACGKQQAPCRPGSLFVELSFPQGAGLESVGVTVSNGAGQKLVDGALPVPAGNTRGSVEITFGAAGYPALTEVQLEVRGTRAGEAVASGRQTVVLGKGCQRVSVTLDLLERDGGALDPRDGGGTDGRPLDRGPDLPAGDAPDAPTTRNDGSSDRGADIPPRDVAAVEGGCAGACTPGQRGPCGRCGMRTCGGDCSWGACADEGACQAGEERSCARCGRERCADNCQWSGTCTGQGVCAAGASEACGNCGTRTCSATCTWSACSGEGTCSSGQTRACGKCGTERCGGGSGCGWSGRCEGEGACAPGETRSCGNCGVERCAGNCQWNGTCESQGACAPGASQRCGRCNLGSQICTSTCAWSTTCSGDTGCAPNTTGTCGQCGTRSCSASCAWSACNEPAVCGCQTSISDGWSYSLSDSSTPWRQIWGNPSTNTGTNVLRLTYDDVVRRAALSGGLALSFSIRFLGDITFHPDMASAAGRFPAIKRTGAQLELGGLYYGSGVDWGTFGGWTGQMVTTDRVEFTFYVRATAKEIAARVQAGNAVFKTGFVAYPQINLAILQLVGANSNGAHDDLGVEIGPISGCAGLTDAAVTAAYNQ